MSLENINGARRVYGPRFTEKVASGVVSTYGLVREQRVRLDALEGLPGSVDNDEVHEVIPAGSLILSARVYFSESPNSTSGTTTVDIGVTEPDGTAVDADGLVVDVAADGSVFGWVVGDGALVGTSVAVDAQITAVASTDDLTAGKGVLVVEYVAPVA